MAVDHALLSELTDGSAIDARLDAVEGNIAGVVNDLGAKTPRTAAGMSIQLANYVTGAESEATQRSGLQAAIADALSRNRELRLGRPYSGAAYHAINASLVTDDGLRVIGDGATVRMSAPDLPAFDGVAVDGVIIEEDLTLRYTGTRNFSGSAWRGGQLGEGAAGVWLSGNGNKVRNGVKIENFPCGVTLTSWNGAAFSGYGEDNEVDIDVDNVAFGLLFHGQDGIAFSVRGNYANADTGSILAPHLVYGSNAEPNRMIRGRGCHARDSADSVAYQFKGCVGGAAGPLQARNCAGLLSLFDSQFLDFPSLVGMDMVTTGGNGQIYLQTATEKGHRLRGVILTMAVTNERAIRIDGVNNFLLGAYVEAAHGSLVDGFDISLHGTGHTVDGLTLTNRLSGGARGVDVNTGSGHTIRNPKISGVKYGIVVDSGVTDTVLDYKAQDIALASGGAAKVLDQGARTHYVGASMKASPPGTGRYIPTAAGGTAAVYTTGTAVMTAAPMWLDEAVPIDRIGVEVVTLGDAASVIRLGIWLAALNGDPGALLLDAGTVVATSTGIKEATVALTLPAGKIWLSAVGQGYSATPPQIRSAQGSFAGLIALDQTEAINNPRGGAKHSGTVAGALPGAWVNSGGRGDVPRLYVRQT